MQEITPSRNSKSGSPGLSFFHFLFQDQPYPEPSERHKEMSPIKPEAGSNYQPLIKRHEDAEVLSSYRHMGVNLKSATNFNGRVHMPEGSASEWLPAGRLVIKLLSTPMTLGAMDQRALGGTFCVKAEEKCANQLHH